MDAFADARYVLKSRSFALVDCHCIDCQRSTGALSDLKASNDGDLTLPVPKFRRVRGPI